jgi:DNA processing protein
MALDAELEAWLTLSLTDGLGNQSCAKLLIAFGGPQQVLAASRKDLSGMVPAKVAAALLGPRHSESLRAVEHWLQDAANRVLTLADAEYPRSLLQMPDPPPVLYVKGRADLLNEPAFAIVGSRHATRQGAAHAEAFAHTLSDAGLTIVSGLALGIDAAAHRGGLAGSAKTVAVIGTGADIVYPGRNRDLAHEIAREGAIVSEFPIGTPPLAENFPRRNRIISGLARGCLVVEAALSSGSLITARLANEQGKDVFAMPGSVNSPVAKGCHRLIKDGAKLVESAEDILEELKLAPSAGARANAKQPVGEEARRIFEVLGFDPCDIDTLAERSGASPQTLSALLTEWEIEGLVESLPGGRFQRLQS